MKIQAKNLFLTSLLLFLCISVSGCSLFGSSQTSTATPTPKSGVTNNPGGTSLAGTPISDPQLDTMAQQTLNDINQYGFGSTNKYGTGIRINWYRDNPTDQQNKGHDGQNDIRTYENMVWYEARHPGDTSMKANIARLQPIVYAEWATTANSKGSSDPKGWIYFLFQRLAQYDNNTIWTNTMKHWATYIAKGIDPNVGVAHARVVTSTADNSSSCPDGYRVDQSLENGLALIDAGTRFNEPSWVQTGKQEVDTVTKQAFVSKYHMFARIVCQGQISDWEAKGGEIGQETDALLRTGSYTHNDTYLNLAKEILDAVSNPSIGLRDTQNGGIYFKLMLDSGTVDKSRKEMRQLEILQSVHEANVIFNNRYADFETSLIKVAKSSFFPTPVAGWMYEVSNDYQLYKGKENWISTEASVIAMEAIQTLLS